MWSYTRRSAPCTGRAQPPTCPAAGCEGPQGPNKGSGQGPSAPRAPGPRDVQGVARQAAGRVQRHGHVAGVRVVDARLCGPLRALQQGWQVLRDKGPHCVETLHLVKGCACDDMRNNASTMQMRWGGTRRRTQLSAVGPPMRRGGTSGSAREPARCTASCSAAYSSSSTRTWRGRQISKPTVKQTRRTHRDRTTHWWPAQREHHHAKRSPS